MTFIVEKILNLILIPLKVARKFVKYYQKLVYKAFINYAKNKKYIISEKEKYKSINRYKKLLLILENHKSINIFKKIYNQSCRDLANLYLDLNKFDITKYYLELFFENILLPLYKEEQSFEKK